MGCSHAVACPLFPLLRASLQGWRDHYCDSEDRWRDCARYQLSLTGERVPISLLPNGARARHLEEGDDGNRPGAAHPGQVPRQDPPPHAGPWQPETRSWSQPAPASPPEPSGHGIATPETMAQFGATPPSAPVWHHQPSPPPQVPQPSDGLARRGRRAPGSKRGWWTRFADWMRGPA
ncbi:hypothetical protein EOT10_09570 [Streptomyces antnestii]|uniref:Uncharacterized protein n=1 Tax=Streptomyces antnestii TaxID=2494256 RepID=A0A3S2VJL4_9ACTN|nr:hypothetical protein EOT10_09570 [Streptomyces sp. San01]